MIRSFHVLAAALVVAPLTGCSWTVFDDLESEAGVVSFEKPTNDSSNWAVAIQESQSGGAGGNLTVIGASQALFNELEIDSTGDITVAANELELNSQFGLGNLETQPTLIADPASDAIALVTRSGSAIVVLNGERGDLDAYQIFGKDRVDGATYMTPPKRSDATMAQLSQVLVAQDDAVIGAHFADMEQPQNEALPQCLLVDDQGPPQKVLVRALGAFRPAGAAYDNVVAWSSTGRLLVYDGGIFNGNKQVPANTCATAQGPVMPSAETGFTPVATSQILTFQDGGVNYAVLQGHDDTDRGFLALYNLDTLTLVGATHSDTKLRTAALLHTGGKHYVAGGYPTTVIDNVTSGQVQVFEVDLAEGISSASALTLYDAQPEDDQSFGRSVAVLSVNDQPMIAVAADNEIFFYFKTALYDDARSR